ncbi:MAG: beta-ketoacyl-[acyl-carrier-protein] synthase II [Gammaproteobacteria bacterium RBG_16_37_9]|nr:MAG: beta-ketoacyl-[acyl-carrier-protein] synthase II [Gammaproteobacteria bacterium RBG_16_37_9]
MTKRRVVVTGLGMVTPLGLVVADTWSALLAGKSGVRTISTFDVSQFPVKICSDIKNFDPALYFDPKEARKTEIFIQYGFAAATQALTDSGLVINEENAARVGVSIGAGIGGLLSIERNHEAFLAGGQRKISPTFIPYAIINMVPGVVAIKHGCKGPNLSIVSACSTGAHNIGNSARLICYGDADVMIAGGCEMATTVLGIGGFAAIRALSKRNDEPTKASRPWDRDRDGFVLGEGAGIVVLEEYEFAKRRGARIYAELAGYGMSDDASHITLPDQAGLGSALAVQNAITDAGINKEEIGYINAHATSTLPGDIAEVIGIKKVFGDYAYKIPVSSTKSMTGHLLGAAGSVEAIISILAMRDQVVPPTINLDNPDDGCDLDFVPHTARSAKIEAVASNSFGFGGTNTCLVFKKI